MRHAARVSVSATASTDRERDMMDGWVQVLTDGLPALRDQRQWTQGDLGEQSGLHRETIGRLERLSPTANRPSALTLTALATAFGYVHLSDFWHALQGAATTAESLPMTRRTDDVQQLVLAYLDCSPEQQQYLRGLANIYAARQRSASVGQAELIDLTNIPYGESVVRAREPKRTAGRKRSV